MLQMDAMLVRPILHHVAEKLETILEVNHLRFAIQSPDPVGTEHTASAGRNQSPRKALAAMIIKHAKR